MVLYHWMVVLHILSALLFYFVHGVSMATAFLLPKEKSAEKMKMLLELIGVTLVPMGVSMLGLLATSIYMASAAHWWLKGWWGISFLIFLFMLVWMSWYSRKYYSPIRKALGMEYMTGFGTQNPAMEPAGADEVQLLIARTNPRLIAAVGIFVTVLLVWLMRFKPF
jgi:hypothetical protein